LLLAGEKIVARQKRDAFDLSTNFQLDNKTNYTICLQFFLWESRALPSPF